MENLKIMTCNVQGLGDALKRRKFFRYFKQKNIDIVMIQETHSIKSKHRVWCNEWGGQILFNNGDLNSRGVVMLINSKVDVEVQDIQLDSEGRILIVKAKNNE